MTDFNTLLRKRLSAPIKDKQGNLIVNSETGEHMTALEAMVMSVVNNAMKGDIGSIAFIRNITRNDDPDDGKEYRDMMRERYDKIRSKIIAQLDGEGLYDGQDVEIDLLVETVVILEQISEQMQAADFATTITEYTRDGNTKTIVNPLISLRNQQQDRFRQQIDKLRADAKERKKIQSLKRMNQRKNNDEEQQ